MQTVKVSRMSLFNAVSANGKAHRDLFLKAQEGYRKAVVEELDKMLSEAREGKPIRRGISLPEPVDHTKDYDRVTRMLEMSVDDIIELSVTEFDHYVMDNWSWKEFATSSNMRYAQ